MFRQRVFSLFTLIYVLATLSIGLVLFFDNAKFSVSKKSAPAQSQQKIVLFWTDWFGKVKVHFDDFGGNTLPGGDEGKTCLFTTDRRRLNESQALIFHGWDLDFGDLPPHRFPWQRWVYYLLESPVRSGLSEKALTRLNSIGLNWTMTYNKELTDVWIPYAKLVPRSVAIGSDLKKRVKHFAKSFQQRPKDALWFVSNCQVRSRREKLVEQLKSLGIGTDSFGNCSGLSPEKAISDAGGPAKFFSQYKFYLSFENSLCDGYVTEKFARGLNLSYEYGLVPITYGGRNGGSDYSYIAPKGSFIVTESYANLEALAEELKNLMTGKTSTAQYYQWHQQYERVDLGVGGSELAFHYGFTSLCKKLFAEQETSCRSDSEGIPITQPCETPERVITDLRSQLGQCYEPKFV